MRLIGLAVVLILSLFVASLAAQADQAKPARIAILSRSAAPEIEAFREGLRDLGHVEGQTYVVEPHYAGGSTTRLRELAAGLTRNRVDLIFAPHGAAAAAAKTAAPDTPVVFISADPIADGLVRSFGRPGGNLTGIAPPVEVLATKKLELLRTGIPAVKRVAVLFIPEVRGSVAQLDGYKVAATAMNIEILPVDVQNENHLATAFAAAVRQRPGAITHIASPLFQNPRAQLLTLAARHRIPAMWDDRAFVVEGGLMSYGADLRLVYRQAATYVDKILKGAKPADLPVEQPVKFDLVINLKTAKVLGLTIPPLLLGRADYVIE